MVQLDRWGIMRPAYNKEEFKTKGSWMHLDQNPILHSGFKAVQGLVSLTDHTNTSGGFLCVPKFHNEFEEFGKAERTNGGQRNQLPYFTPSLESFGKDFVSKRMFVDLGL